MTQAMGISFMSKDMSLHTRTWQIGVNCVHESIQNPPCSEEIMGYLRIVQALPLSILYLRGAAS